MTWIARACLTAALLERLRVGPAPTGPLRP